MKTHVDSTGCSTKPCRAPGENPNPQQLGAGWQHDMLVPSCSEPPDTSPSQITSRSGGRHGELEGDNHHLWRGAGQSPAGNWRLRACPYI